MVRSRRRSSDGSKRQGIHPVRPPAGIRSRLLRRPRGKDRCRQGRFDLVQQRLLYRLQEIHPADDLLQDTYIRLLRIELPELDEAQLKNYLYKTARSVMLDHFRRSTREQRHFDSERDPERSGPATGAMTYPYYTVRGPRDFLAGDPRPIGP